MPPPSGKRASSPLDVDDGVQTKKHTSESGSALNLFQYMIDPGWRDALQPLTKKPYWPQIERALEADIVQGKKCVFPPLAQVFEAFNLCPLQKTKVVLIGQDPYHDNGQAHGLCFSVGPTVRPPPSLVNMYQELQRDIPGFVPPSHGSLVSWAKQGILMLNATLTVEAHKANSHSGIGWQKFTDDVVKYVSDNTTGTVFLLWGGFAQKKGAKVDRQKHRVIETAHPSPLSVLKWRGCQSFSKCNAALKDLGKEPIDWNLPRDPS